MFGSNHFHKLFLLLLVISLGLFSWSEVAPATDKGALMPFSNKGSNKAQAKSGEALPEIPENLDQAKINEIVAGLSDDQVRRLLIQELQKAAAAATASAAKRQKTVASGLAGIAQKAEENISLFHKRLADIRSGAVSVPDFLPKAYADLRDKGGTSNILLMFAKIFVLLAAGLGAEWLFGRYTADMRKRLMTSTSAHWTVKFKRLGLRAMIEFISICVFSVATLVVFFLFFNLGPVARLVLAIYLVVVLVIRGIGLLMRFLLAPKVPALRYLPLADNTALYLYRAVMRIVLVVGVGFLFRGLLEVQGVREESIIFIRALVAAVFLGMAVHLLFDNRESVARIICRGTPDSSTGINLFRTQFASFWHLLALPYVILVWGLWVFCLLVGRNDLVIPIFALLISVPLFIVLDWVGQRLLSAIFGLVDKHEAGQQLRDVEATSDEKTVEKTSAHKAGPGGAEVSRFVPIVRRCLSLSIAGIIFFWLLQLWGFEVHVGEEITGAALKILLIVSLAYVGWKLIEDAINRRLKKVQGNLEVDEDSDAGGTGGSRIGTLLQIFRKFLLVVFLVTVGLIILSAIGIDIKPLLAGAGILGLAIGLGTQNLIKDIVSGLFFLIDDAFRLGDYVESGKAKGTVEAITIRSLKLRHNRGMVHNVPFSQLGSVTNFSRDYNITKLDIRVPFGTDLDKVRKIVKKINKEIDQDEELGPNLLGPIKSMGVNAFEDSALIVRVKFKTKPGLGSLIQRQVFKRLKELFDENGLEFATRHVMVRLPEETAHGKQDAEGEPHSIPSGSHMKTLSGAAAAAIVLAISEEEAKKQSEEQESDS